MSTNDKKEKIYTILSVYGVAMENSLYCTIPLFYVFILTRASKFHLGGGSWSHRDALVINPMSIIYKNAQL